MAAHAVPAADVATQLQELARWREIFRGADGEPKSPDAVHSELENLRNQEIQLRKQMEELQRQNSWLVLRVNAQDQRVAALEAALTHQPEQPHSQQQQPLQPQTQSSVDAAAGARAGRLREAVREREGRWRAAQEGLDAVSFAAGSVAGRQLVARCRALLLENAQLAQQAALAARPDAAAAAAAHATHANELSRALARHRRWSAALELDLQRLQTALLARITSYASVASPAPPAGLPTTAHPPVPMT